MKNIILTFSITSLFFVSIALYEFASGKIERPSEGYLQSLTGK